MWEVPLMACLSETYFQVDMIDWDYTGQEGILIVEISRNHLTDVRSGVSEGEGTS
jgi:hypothetical protein